jgi:hypothetical protein
MKQEQLKQEFEKFKDFLEDHIHSDYDEMKITFRGLINKYLSTIPESEETEKKEVLYDLSEIKPSQKAKLIEDYTEITAEYALKLFYMLGLKTHIETKLINDVNGDEFIFSLKKI